jgi:hypothetical protein
MRLEANRENFTDVQGETDGERLSKIIVLPLGRSERSSNMKRPALFIGDALR